MKDRELKKIIRHLSGESSEQEKRAVRSLKEQHPKEYSDIEDVFHRTKFERIAFEKTDLKDLIKKDPALIHLKGHRPVYQKRWILIAASIAILLSMGVTANYLMIVSNTINNSTGSTMKSQLPDNSVVTLDKGATLKYKTSLTGQFKRDCSLDGQAYFNVTPSYKTKFTVRTSNARVTVLGTRFTISTSNNRSQVILEEGSVQVSSKGSGESRVISRAGEQLLVNNSGIEKHNTINKHLYMSWREGRLEFQNCTIGEALGFLEDTWNVKVALPDSVSSSMKLIGTAPSDDPELILEAIKMIVSGSRDR